MVLIEAGTLVGVVVTLLLAIYAFKKQELNEGGTIAAICMGMAVFIFGGWTWLALLMVFFVSSNIWSKFKADKKVEASSEFAKTGLRDAWQVGANGLLPAIIAAAYFVQPGVELFAAFVGAVATVTADTWATEVGVFDQKPRLITNGKRVAPGTSGGVSALGLGATIAASSLIAVMSIAFNSVNNFLENQAVVREVIKLQFVGGIAFVAIVTFAGLIGSLADSLFGATIQAMYYCNKCRKETERTMHKCGHKTVLLKGHKLIDNDVVNFLSSCIGAGTAFALAAIVL